MGRVDRTAGAPAKKEPPVAPWAGDMLPREAGPGKNLRRVGGGGFSFHPSARLEWVSRETDGEGRPLRVRRPWGIPLVFPAGCFLAAGRLYFGQGMLAFRKMENSPWARDIYGRDVLVLTECFPCFDSADYLYEDRRFRWYFLCRRGKLTCVYHTDRTPIVTVTEDVRDLEASCWGEMNRKKCFGDDARAPDRT